MRTHFRLTAFAAAAFFAIPGTLAAQEKPSAILNAVEVRQLVARAEPADNARLAAHFSALADRYTAEAKRHTAMSASFVGNPSRTVGSGMSMHCKRLAELNTQSATTLRELAAYHQKLAAGTPAAPPRDGAAFQGGAGAPVPTEKELNALAAKASTPAEHRALEEYFLTLAKKYDAEASEHTTTANIYRGTKIASAAVHCDRLVSLAREEAKEATAAAAMHKQLANVAR